MDTEDTTLYSTLGIDATTIDVLSLSARDITRAYRQAALRWHPDKNPDDTNAAARFSEIFMAYEKLSNATTRSEYDARIAAARGRQSRFQEMDEGRRAMRLELLRRERAAKERKAAEGRGGAMDAATMQRMQRELERLRKEARRESREVRREAPVEGKPRRAEPKRAARRGGAWADVKGFEDFRSSGTSGFSEFESEVLAGKFAL